MNVKIEGAQISNELTVSLQTTRGPITIQVKYGLTDMQASVFHTSREQPTFFMVFPLGADPDIPALAKSLMEGEELPSNTDITDRVPVAIAAGTGSKVTDVQWVVHQSTKEAHAN